MTHDDLFLFINENKLAVLSSVGVDGTPQSALMGIAVTTGLEIVFDTLTTSRKYRNLIANPAAAFVIGCAGEKTLQYEGFARQLTGTDAESYHAIYFAAWPDGKTRQSWPDICYFAVKPRWIRLSDYGTFPPLIQEFQFANQPSLL